MAKETAPETAEATGGKKSKKMLWIAIALIVLLGGGAGGFFGYRALTAKEDDPAADEQAQPDAPASAYGVEIAIPEKPQTFNLKETRSYLSLQIKIVVPADKPEVQDNVKKRESQIMDMLINILNEKTVEELKSQAGKDELKQQIRERIATFIAAEEIQDILIAKFLIQ